VRRAKALAFIPLLDLPRQAHAASDPEKRAVLDRIGGKLGALLNLLERSLGVRVDRRAIDLDGVGMLS
jgi:hypothetical protein